MIAQVTPAVLLFVTLAQGAISNVEEFRGVAIRSAAEWRALWTEHGGGDLPAVDFAQSMVVAVFLGSRSTAGYTVEISAIREEAGRTVVEFVERQPPRDGLVAQMLTSPFHIVRLTKTSGVVEFRRRDP